MSKITPVTHTEKVVAGQVDAVTHFEHVIAEYGGGDINEQLKAGTNIVIEPTADGKAKISASGEVSSEDTYAREEITAILDGTTIDSFGDVETALEDKVDKVSNKALSTNDFTDEYKTMVDNSLSTTTAESTYQPKGSYATTSDISDMATKTWVGQQGYMTSADEVPEVTSSDDGKVLKASYSGGTGTYSWQSGGGSGGTTDYTDLSNKPSINSVTLSGNKTTSDLGIDEVPEVGVNDDGKVLKASYTGGVGTYSWQTSGGGGGGTSDYSDLTNKPSVNSVTLSGNKTSSDLGLQSTIDSSHKLSADLIDDTSSANKFNVQADWNQTTDTASDYIKNKPTIPAAQVNSDWSSSSGVSQILNKPTLGTAAALDVAVSGDASTSQVVKGDDTRLTDSRNAADVSSWAKAANKPSYVGSEITLTGYVEAQSKASVAATDTANAAIGKLEYRVETNENNISLLQQQVGYANTELEGVL